MKGRVAARNTSNGCDKYAYIFFFHDKRWHGELVASPPLEITHLDRALGNLTHHHHHRTTTAGLPLRPPEVPFVLAQTKNPYFYFFLARSWNDRDLHDRSPRSLSNTEGQRPSQCPRVEEPGVGEPQRSWKWRGSGAEGAEPLGSRCRVSPGKGGFLMTHTEKHPLVCRAWKAPKDCLRNSSRGSQEDEAGTRRAPFPR